MIQRVYTHDLLKTCIEDILSVIAPVEDDHKKRLHAIQEVADSVYSIEALRGADVKPFGSFVSNLYAKSGDVDVSVNLFRGSNLAVGKKKKQIALRGLMRALRNRGVATSIEFIPTARVPVLSYVSNHFGIPCDISVDNYPGLIKSKIFYWINNIDDRFGDMVLLVKEWAKSQNINDPKNGTLNSHSLCLLVLFHFQTCDPVILPPLKEIYDGNVAEMMFYDEKHVDVVCAANVARFRRQNMWQRNESSLPCLLVSFFHKFSSISGLSSKVISTYTGRFERIQDNPSWAKSYSLFIEDPFERPDNAARAVGPKELQRIGSAFNYVSFMFTDGALADRNELMSLLCTPAVESILADGSRGNRHARAPLNQHDKHIGYVESSVVNHYDDTYHERDRGYIGSRPSSHEYTKERQTARSYQYHEYPKAYNPEHLTAGQYQNTSRPQDYTTGLQTAVPLRYHDHPTLHTKGSRYQNQQRREYHYSPYQHAATRRYEAVDGRSRRFHDEPTWDSGYQTSESHTAWDW